MSAMVINPFCIDDRFFIPEFDVVECGNARFCLDGFRDGVKARFDEYIDKYVEISIERNINWNKKQEALAKIKEIEQFRERFFFSDFNNIDWWLGTNGHARWGHDYFFHHKCKKWFSVNAMKLLNVFLEEIYMTLDEYIVYTQHLVKFFNLFAEWFNKKRDEFMDKTITEIQKNTGVSIPKTPKAHGGVANLLKILTKTMETQGSDIRSIAKVQYSVCMQAGIFIPDEFINDVAVSLDMPLDTHD